MMSPPSVIYVIVVCDIPRSYVFGSNPYLAIWYRRVYIDQAVVCAVRERDNEST
jgi:hypothetical protein